MECKFSLVTPIVSKRWMHVCMYTLPVFIIIKCSMKIPYPESPGWLWSDIRGGGHCWPGGNIEGGWPGDNIWGVITLSWYSLMPWENLKLLPKAVKRSSEMVLLEPKLICWHLQSKDEILEVYKPILVMEILNNSKLSYIYRLLLHLHAGCSVPEWHKSACYSFSNSTVSRCAVVRVLKNINESSFDLIHILPSIFYMIH